MSKVSMNLQDSFLNQVRKEGTEIKMILLDGTTLSGVVKGFDNFTVILCSRGAQHLIYKHAISQLVWRRPAARGEQAAEEAVANPNTGPNAKKDGGFNRLDLSQVKFGATGS